MGIGSSGVVNCANTYLGTANYTVADGYVADRTVIVDGNGPAQLNLNFARDEVLDPRITFSRTSNATRVNAQGLIEYAPHNLLTYSENFDNAVWIRNGASTVTTNNGVAPDGTLTADTFTATSNNPTMQQVVGGTVGIAYTTSIWIKRKTGTGQIYLRSVENLNVPITVTNDWQRFSLATVSTTTTIRAGVAIANNGDEIYIWGAQLNIDSLQPYYTTSVKNLLGYSQNFENAAWTKSNSSVLTNLLTYSQEFDNAAWIKTTATLTANVATAPDGTTTADNLTATGVDSAVRQQNISATAGQSYVFSVYLRADTPTTLSIFIIDAGGGAGNTQQVVNVTTSWQRFTVTRTLSAGTTVISTQIGGANTFSTGESVYCWGAQLVQGTNPEEYTVTTSAPAPIQVMGPLGFLGAEKLVEDTAIASEHRIASATITWTGNGQYTASFYAKAAGRTKFDILFGTSANWVNGDPARMGTFDLTSGTLRTTPTLPGIASITNIGNGWFRCSITSTAIASPSASSIFLRLCDASGSATYTGDGTSGIYIFGAQLSDSASLDPYSYNFGVAPTSSAYYGPRFDYDPVTLAPKGLLIEESRTNLLTYSQEFDNASWGKSGVTVTANAIVAPDGTLTTDALVEDNSLSGHRTDQTVSANSTIIYTTSYYVKANGRTWASLLIDTAGNGSRAYYNLATGQVGTIVNTGTGSSSTASIISVGGGWYRCTLSCIPSTVNSGSVRSYISGTTGDNTPTYTGTTSLISIYIWGAQLEAGSFPTSYIPTTSAQVTRAADNASMVGTNFSSWYNQSEGTVAVGYDIFSNTINCGAMAISDGTLGNRIIIRASTPSAQTTSIGVVSSTTNWSLGFINQLVNTSTKAALAFKQDSIAFTRNTEGPVTDNSALIPVVNQLRLGADGDGSLYLNGHIKTFKFFSKRFLNTYLQSLTQ